MKTFCAEELAIGQKIVVKNLEGEEQRQRNCRSNTEKRNRAVPVMNDQAYLDRKDFIDSDVNRPQP